MSADIFIVDNFLAQIAAERGASFQTSRQFRLSNPDLTVEEQKNIAQRQVIHERYQRYIGEYFNAMANTLKRPLHLIYLPAMLASQVPGYNAVLRELLSQEPNPARLHLTDELKKMLSFETQLTVPMMLKYEMAHRQQRFTYAEVFWLRRLCEWMFDDADVAETAKLSMMMFEWLKSKPVDELDFREQVMTVGLSSDTREGTVAAAYQRLREELGAL